MIYNQIIENKAKNKKSVAILIDPDKTEQNQLIRLIEEAIIYGVDYFFFGGSLVTSSKSDEYISLIKESCDIPLVLFPSNPSHISDKADAILFLSLISGRNPETLIGHHVIAAPLLRKTNLEIIPTGYMLIDGGKPTSVSYMSNTLPIPSEKSDIAVCTAMAGEMLGQKLIYMDAGSGAKRNVNDDMIRAVRRNISLPLIIGGGINNYEKAINAFQSGADIVVVGSLFENQENIVKEFLLKIKEYHESYSNI